MNFTRSACARLAAFVVLAALAAGLPNLVLAQGAPIAGTWNFVPARSHFTPGPARYKSGTLTLSDGQMTFEGVDAQDKPVKGVIMDVADGKPHPVTGMAQFDSSAITRFGETSISYIYRRGKSIAFAGSRTVSADRNTVTFGEKMYDSNGKEIGNAVMIFAKPGFEVATVAPTAAPVAAPVVAQTGFTADETAAIAALEKGDADEAIRLFSKAIASNQPTPMLYYDYVSRGIAYAKKNQTDMALADFDSAIKAKPDDADAHFRRGNMRLNLKQYDAAIEDLTEVVKLDEMNAMAYRLRGFAYNTQGKDTLAAPDYDKACMLNKDLCM